MPITIEATYEGGVLKPSEPLPLREHEKVTVTIEPKSSWVEETYGICSWKGSAEEAERFATDPDFDFPPPPEEPGPSPISCPEMPCSSMPTPSAIISSPTRAGDRRAATCCGGSRTGSLSASRLPTC
jgi:predicted DNA-binding antitoxin AbrB/MazE fold protein